MINPLTNSPSGSTFVSPAVAYMNRKCRQMESSWGSFRRLAHLRRHHDFCALVRPSKMTFTVTCSCPTFQSAVWAYLLLYTHSLLDAASLPCTESPLHVRL